MNSKSSHALREERILGFWKEERIFEKSLEKEAPRGDFTFYDGPPFANGSPHYGHILAGTIKDVIPRFKTMQGYRVRRRWGWDCHGLPVENLIEKELKLAVKKDILNYGVGKFNEAARESVMRYADEWRQIVPRLGRWVDMDDDYRTMDASYTETVWWIFKKLHDKGLIYEGFKSMYICPRCETTLSNFEVAQGYKDITDISVYVKFRLTEGSDKTVEATNMLVWTTTPWTLPGNAALAVNPKIEYVKIKVAEGPEEKKGLYILAKERLAALKDIKYEIIQTLKGSALVGRAYQPLFSYYANDKGLKNKANGWKIYAADFVTTDEGTGVVHVAPAFGADDYELFLERELPFIQHVALDGHFKREVSDFAGLSVKPIDTAEDKTAHQTTDIEIIKWLAHHNVLFDKVKITHSYPHCWRCETPLLNYAASSWFVKVTAFRDALVKENEKIAWVPPEIGRNRFGRWLEGARDWAISRSRFWGAPIPVWREEAALHDAAPAKPGKIEIIGSVEDLKKLSAAHNTYYVMRHGEAANNIEGVLSGDVSAPHHLTSAGAKQVAKAADALKKIKFDLIFASPFVRTQETVAILKEKLGWKDAQVISDERIRELGAGVWHGRKVADFIHEFPLDARFARAPEGGESYADIKKRMGDFLYDLEKKYRGKTVLIITHETPLFLLVAAAHSLDRAQSIQLRGDREFIGNAEVRKIEFSPLPHNAEYELDLHRPFIDDFELTATAGRRWRRVPDVFDCWFESGSMPYAEVHYPFAKDEAGKGADPGFDPDPGLLKKSRGFPADFIAEGVDQTRGWFYSMLVLGVALFGRSPYKKAIVNGLILAEDGRKMSKRDNNYPDPMEVVDAYGADALRYYLLSSPAVRGQEFCFSVKGVDEAVKKIVNRLLNVVAFYELYAEPAAAGGTGVEATGISDHLLDRWIYARLDQTTAVVTGGLESGELDRAARPLLDLTDDLSTWYIRRSRDRFKSDDQADRKAALRTTRRVLIQLSKLLAPFMPFLAEEIFERVTKRDHVKPARQTDSVHLNDWPAAGAFDAELLANMQKARTIASQGLEARMAAKLHVRQPLGTLRVRDPGDWKTAKNETDQLVRLISDEVNVKEVVFGAPLENEVELDTAITPELKEEGEVRELVHSIQDMRKEKGLSRGTAAVLIVPHEMKNLVEKHGEAIKHLTGLSAIQMGDALALKI